MSSPGSSLFVRGARPVPLSVDDAAPARPVDLLVTDGVVVRCAPGLDRPAGVEEVDADGRWLAPGLWDQHTHLTQWTLASQRLDLGAAATPEDALALVAARVEEQADQPGMPVVGWGHRGGHWDREVTVAELDAVSGGTPVVLISSDAHHGWLNTTALMHLALPVRDNVVREGEWFAAFPRLAALVGQDDSSPEAFARTLAQAASLGVVGLVDLEFGASRDGWVERWHQGCDTLRVRWATYADTLDDVLAAGLRTGDPLLPGGPGGPGSPGSAGLMMGPLKIISDGSLNTRTAWCCEPYADAARLEHPAGQPNLDGAELRELLRRAHAGGLEVATHAIGDAALGEALSAYADTGARGSVEHAQLARRDDVRRMARLGIRASVQPAHLLDDRDLTERVWAGRAERCFAFRWMLDDGVELVLGSDAPVSPLDPWLAIAAAVHRSDDDRDAWHPEQSLTAREALVASVDGAGTVGVGSPADLVLLDQDPLATHTDLAAARTALRGTTVALTTVAGRIVHRAL